MEFVGALKNPFLLVPTIKDIEADLKALMDGIKKKINEWWNGVVLDFKLSLPSWMRDLLGVEMDEPGGGAKMPETGSTAETTTGSTGGTTGTMMFMGGKNGLPDFKSGIKGNDNSFAGLLAAAIQSGLATLPAEVRAAAAAGVAEGVGNITIEGNITTGNVVLDTGAVAGQIAPRVNLLLGGIPRLRSR